MRNRSLHQALRAFAEEAALQLCADAAMEAEVPFEVVEVPGERTALYCYRPLTGRFIRERLDVLAALPSHEPAADVLADLGGVDAYLRLRGEPRIPEDPRDRAEAALRTFLESLYADVSDFEFVPSRFSRAYSELESAVYVSRALTAVIAPLHGLELESEEVPLDEDLSLVRGDTLDEVPPEAVWSGRGQDGAPNVLALLTVEAAPGDAPPLAAAAARFRRILTALRLADANAFALGAAAWTRADAGAWQLEPLGGAGARAGEPYRVVPDEEDELRGFCNLIARRMETHARAEVAWALERFEMGCERTDPMRGLTDHLLSLRALLEPEGPASGRLSQRLAAICAVPEKRAALAERVAHAISLERALVAGVPPKSAPDAGALVADVAHHLRSLLRDVLCGHLEPDLVRVADELLAEAVTGEAPRVNGAAEAPSPQRISAPA